MYTYGWVPLLSTWNYLNLLISYTPTQNKKFKKKKNSRERRSHMQRLLSSLVWVNTYYKLFRVSLQPHVRQIRHHMSHHFEAGIFGQVEGLAHCLHSVAPEEREVTACYTDKWAGRRAAATGGAKSDTGNGSSGTKNMVGERAILESHFTSLLLRRPGEK